MLLLLLLLLLRGATRRRHFHNTTVPTSNNNTADSFLSMRGQLPVRLNTAKIAQSWSNSVLFCLKVIQKAKIKMPLSKERERDVKHE